MPVGTGDVFEMIRRGRVSTRGDIQELTGLSRVTVSQRVDSLLASTLIIESGRGAPTGGRRSRSLTFNPDFGRVAVADVDTRHSSIGITDLTGRILASRTIDVAVVDGPDATLGALASEIQSLYAELDDPVPLLLGVGISLPGPIDPRTGRPSEPPIMPGWDAYPVPDRLSEALGVPAYVSNDADAAAVGEQVKRYPDVHSLFLLKVSTGIGTGIVIDGRVYPGTDGGAGDIGHVRLGPQYTERCQCGAIGCLASVASGRAVAAALRERGYSTTSGSDVGALLSSGNPDAVELTRQAGAAIGQVLATVVCLLNPGVVVVSGTLASAPLLAGIRDSLYPLSLPRATRHLMITQGLLGQDAPLAGLSKLVVDRELAADSVTQRLAELDTGRRMARGQVQGLSR